MSAALALAVGGCAAGSALGASIDAVLVAGVAAVAAILIAGSAPEPDERASPRDRVSPEDQPPRLDDVIEAFAEPVLVIADRSVVCANTAARALLGEHIVGDDVRMAIRHPAAAERLLGDIDGDGRPIHLVGLGTRDQRWEMRIAPVGEGRHLVYLADQTSHHAAEKMRVDFVANASHELRTPLASLLGFIETLTDEAGEDAQLRARFLKVMNDEARRMQRLIDDLMSLSRIEAEKYRPPEQAVDLVTLTEEVRAALVGTHGGRGADLVVEVEDTPPPVTGDRAQLSQVLHNLIGNAMKYGRQGTPVRIGLAPADAMVRLTVGDQGDGIPQEHLPRLTERFYRVDPGRSRALGGTGLGLSIVKHIVERHRGRLDIASTPGVGTTITVLLPMAAVIKT